MKTPASDSDKDSSPTKADATTTNQELPSDTITSSPSPTPPVVNTSAAAKPVSQQEQNRASSTNPEETFREKLSRWSYNCLEKTGLCCFTAKEQSQIAALEFQIAQRQKKFGVDYLTMVLEHNAQQQQQPNSSPPQAPIAEALERLVEEAVTDIHSLQAEIDSRMVSIDQRTEQVQSRLQPAPGTPATPAAAVLVEEGSTPPPAAAAPAPPASAFATETKDTEVQTPAPSDPADSGTAEAPADSVSSPPDADATNADDEKAVHSTWKGAWFQRCIVTRRTFSITSILMEWIQNKTKNDQYNIWSAMLIAKLSGDKSCECTDEFRATRFRDSQVNILWYNVL